jgi:pimeloyl-ACP methyl ester carboxylesterase
MEPRSTFIDLGGSRRHVVEWGQRGSPVLLLQHGMRDHARSWDWVAARFGQDYHIVVPDLRGHGDSDWAGNGAYDIADYVGDLADVVDALEIERLDLVGHSLGGHISLRYAAAFPEKLTSLAIIEAIELPIIREQRREITPYPARLRQWIENQRARQARAPRFYPTIEDAQARMAEEHPTIDGETLAHLTTHGLIAQAGAGWRWKYDNACRFRAPEDAHGVDLDQTLAAVTCPTLLAYGEASWIPLPPAERLARLRDHRIVTFPGASHWLHHQAREAFLHHLAAFLPNHTTSPSKETAHA